MDFPQTLYFDPIDMPALDHVMIRVRTNDNQLFWQTMSCIADAYINPSLWDHYSESGLILSLRPAYERRRYTVTPTLIGWAQI